MFTKKTKWIKIPLVLFFTVLLTGFMIPENCTVPVENATEADWNKNAFWAYPWGKSITHKGIDIFANEGSKVKAATGGFVIFKGSNGRGGNTILVLGPKWRMHYYAHLQNFNCKNFQFVAKGEKIGTVGKTGNAKDTPAHLHYSILTPFPYFWKIDRSKQGWLKAFYLNPHPKLINSN